MAPGSTSAEPREAAGDGVSTPVEVAAAYDAIAPDYDDLVVQDSWMRHVLWAEYARLVKAGYRVLELGCGTGLDTLFLARRGVGVSAIDASAEMIARLAEKAREQGLGEALELRVGDVAELGVYPAESFDAAISAFAVLNTVGDLERLAAGVARTLRPGGRCLVHLLAPNPLWEPHREHVVAICGRPVLHRLLPAREAVRRLAPPLRLRRAYGLGFLWPRDAIRWIPMPVARRLGLFETRLGAWPPFLDWGRFFVLDLEKPA